LNVTEGVAVGPGDQGHGASIEEAIAGPGQGSVPLDKKGPLLVPILNPGIRQEDLPRPGW
jgi:hypothetical protein